MRTAVVLLAVGVLIGCGGSADDAAEGDRPPPAAPPPAADDPKQQPSKLRCPRAADPGAAPAVTFDTRALVGMDEADARARAAAEGCTLRVVERDGEPLIRTEDFRRDRVNVKVRGGVVTAIDGVG